MERHVTDHPRSTKSKRLSRYLEHERTSRLRGPHQAVNVLRRLPRGAEQASQRMRNYLRIDRWGAS